VAIIPLGDSGVADSSGLNRIARSRPVFVSHGKIISM
jgi:hypothetical protein